MYFKDILRTTLQKYYIEKCMIWIWVKSVKFNTTIQRLAEDLKLEYRNLVLTFILAMFLE